MSLIVNPPRSCLTYDQFFQWNHAATLVVRADAPWHSGCLSPVGRRVDGTLDGISVGESGDM